MCGFTGILFSKSGSSPDVSMVDCLCGKLTHRGPDYVGRYQDDQVSLIHHRLSIIDLTDEANQPMKDPETGNLIVFNGEIYNYKELKSAYPDILWRTQSDTEVLLKLYERLGESFVEKLNGIFAFAIYDKKQGRVLLCRDRFGVKPLYYCETKNGFIFSSEIKSILPFAGVSYDPTVIFDYLEYGRLVHDRRTFFQNIYSLEPAHYLRFDLETTEQSVLRYWDISGESLLGNMSDEDVIERTYSELQNAMRLNMVSDVEVAISLSSGTDSTLILRLAQQHASRLKAFTFGFEESAYDEVCRIKEQESLNGIDLHPVYLRQTEMLDLLREAVYYFETPLGGVGTLSAYNMMKAVHLDGIKVMLAGEGSDEIFGGYQYYFPAYFKDLEDDPERLANEVARYAEGHGVVLTPGSEAYRKLTDQTDQKVVLAPDGTGMCHGYASNALRAMAKSTSLNDRSFASHLFQVMYRDLTEKKLPKLLHFQDRAGMASSVETRVPFLDHCLAEFIYQLDGRFKIRDGRSKYLLKTILKDRFGYVEKSQTKHYVATPQREWFKSQAVSETVIATLRDGKLVSEGLIDFERFEKDYRQYISSPELGNSFFVWKLINLEYLFEQPWN